ncbi:MAG: hypothetical protein ACXVBW_07585, partial [Bdellovibrionota bacterium]
MSTTAHLNQAGVLDLISEAGFMAKIVLLLLFGASVFCWAVIVTKWRTLKKAMSQNETFLNTFWNGKNIDEIVAKTDRYPGSPVAAVFKSGVKELKKLSASDSAVTTGTEKVENIYR